MMDKQAELEIALDAEIEIRLEQLTQRGICRIAKTLIEIEAMASRNPLEVLDSYINSKW